MLCKKVVMATWLCNLTGKSSNRFAKIKSKQIGSGNSLAVNLEVLGEPQNKQEVQEIVFPEQALNGAVTWLLAELNEMQTVKML